MHKSLTSGVSTYRDQRLDPSHAQCHLSRWKQRKMLFWGTGKAMVQQLLQKLHSSVSRALKGKAKWCLLHGRKKAGGPAYLWRLQMKYRIADSCCHQEGDSGLNLLFSLSDCTDLAWWCARGLKRQEAEFIVSLTSQAPKLTMEKVNIWR